jgi:hypothetical protein
MNSKTRKLTKTVKVRLEAQTLLKIQAIAENNHLSKADIIRLAVASAIPVFKQKRIG